MVPSGGAPGSAGSARSDAATLGCRESTAATSDGSGESADEALAPAASGGLGATGDGALVLAAGAGLVVWAAEAPGLAGLGLRVAAAVGAVVGWVAVGVGRGVGTGVGFAVGRGVGVALGAGGAMLGGALLPNAHPSTVPCAGRDELPPDVLYVHDPPRLACQYDQ